MGNVTGFDPLYDLFMSPLERHALRGMREWLVPQAKGKVLEIGTGTGANLPFYAMDKISSLMLTDIDARPELLRRRFRRNPVWTLRKNNVDVISADTEALPFADGSFDTVISTLVFCSVPDPEGGLQEIRRVLRFGGTFLFIEHVLPGHPWLAAFFQHLTPAWRRIASGCHLNRSTVKTIEAAGFSMRVLRFGRWDIFVAGCAEKLINGGLPARTGLIRSVNDQL